MISFINSLNRRSFLSKSTLSFASLMTGSLKSHFNWLYQNSLSDNKKIPTLSGYVDVTNLGVTLMHEHILSVLGNIPVGLREASIDKAVGLLNDAKAVGIESLVDLSPYRNIELYRIIARKTKINLIVSTGYYLHGSSPTIYTNHSELQMEKRMYQEVTQGIDGTAIKAGIIKVAGSNYKLSEWEQRVFRAAARVQKATGVPIAAHACEGALEQFELLVQNGADPNHLNFAHIESEFGWRGRSRDQIAEEFLTIVKGGGYLLFNNFSCEFYTKWRNLVYLIRYYCDKGYADRIFISEDCNWEWKNGRPIFEAEEEHPEAAKRTYAYLMTNEVPLMMKSGFSKGEIDTFLVKNPRNYFSRGKETI